jgi:thiol-disulfide isomerase/thioredoxin
MSRIAIAAIASLALGPVHAAEPPAGFIVHDEPRPLADIAFATADGESGSLSDYRGKVVLVNIWATWCPPCREEMPTLDRLQAELGGPDFLVMPLSIDTGGVEVVQKFYDEIGISHLGIYLDESMQAMRDLGAVGLPTTLLIDREGREIGRLVGPAEWDAPEMIEFLREAIERKDSASRPMRLRHKAHQGDLPATTATMSAPPNQRPIS